MNVFLNCFIRKWRNRNLVGGGLRVLCSTKIFKKWREKSFKTQGKLWQYCCFTFGLSLATESEIKIDTTNGKRAVAFGGYLDVLKIKDASFIKNRFAIEYFPSNTALRIFFIVSFDMGINCCATLDMTSRSGALGKEGPTFLPKNYQNPADLCTK